MAVNVMRETAAWLSIPSALLHLFYASQGGIASPPALAWALALGTVLGSALVWVAARRGPWVLAWVGLALIILPAVPDWPAIGVSPGGLLALALMALAGVGVLLGMMYGRPPPLASTQT